MTSSLDPLFKTPTLEALPWDVSPADILHRWPRSEALCVLWSGEAGPSSRWVSFANPARRITFGAAAKATELLDFFSDLPMPPNSGHESPQSDHPPFRSGWMGWMAYEVGGLLEPAAVTGPPAAPPGSGPLMEWFRVDGVLAFDTHQRRWWRTNGDRWHLPSPVADQAFGFTTGPAAADDPAAYARAVSRTIEFTKAGDIYQANITREIAWPFKGSGRGLFGALMRESSPWFGAYFEADDPWARRIIASASPELFLSFDAATREVCTRPMKGTGGSATALRDSVKDASELTMIVDLMRNDLGRVCTSGSVRVEDHRAIEHHGGPNAGLLQTTTTVRGTLEATRTHADLIRAAFPAGSITGAPKIRAMQIIRELEQRNRGVYCGAIGAIDDSGSLQLSVAIRTACIVGTAMDGPGATTTDGVDGTLTYGVGGGIVTDSDPAAEWRETDAKAAAIRRIADAHGSADATTESESGPPKE